MITELPEPFDNLVNLEQFYFRPKDTIEFRLLPSSIINLRNMIHITGSINMTPQQKRYYDWIQSNKEYEFNEYHEDILIKSALKCS